MSDLRQAAALSQPEAPYHVGAHLTVAAASAGRDAAPGASPPDGVRVSRGSATAATRSASVRAALQEPRSQGRPDPGVLSGAWQGRRDRPRSVSSGRNVTHERRTRAVRASPSRERPERARPCDGAGCSWSLDLDQQFRGFWMAQAAVVRVAGVFQPRRSRRDACAVVREPAAIGTRRPVRTDAAPGDIEEIHRGGDRVVEVTTTSRRRSCLATTSSSCREDEATARRSGRSTGCAGTISVLDPFPEYWQPTHNPAITKLGGRNRPGPATDPAFLAGGARHTHGRHRPS